MKKQIIILFIILLFITVVIACSSSSNDQTSNEQTTEKSTALAENQAPTATQTTQPSATSTPTKQPSPSLTFTPIPSPTPEGCNHSLLQDAITSLSSLDSYWLRVEVEAVEPVENLLLMSMKMSGKVKIKEGEIEALEFNMQTLENPGQDIEMIFVNDRAYFRTGFEEWQVFEGEMANAALSRFTENQFLQPELVNNLSSVDCTISNEKLRDQDVQRYHFSGFGFEGLSNLRGITFEEVGAELSSTEMDIWLISYKDFFVPVQLELGFELVQADTLFNFQMIEEILNLNVPTGIEIPEGVATPFFFLELPLPDNADIITKNENLLVFSTFATLDEIHFLFAEYLENNGWSKEKEYTVEEQGIAFEVIEYSHEGQGLAIGAGDQDGITIVIAWLVEIITDKKQG